MYIGNIFGVDQNQTRKCANFSLLFKQPCPLCWPVPEKGDHKITLTRVLTLSQTTNFRYFHTQRVCGGQFQIR